MPPQCWHGGSASPARTRSSARSIGNRPPQLRQITKWTVPCTSITSSSLWPARWCRPSMFWVMSACSVAAPFQGHQRAVPGVRLGRPGRMGQPALPRQPADFRVGHVVADIRHALRFGVQRPHAFAGRGSPGCRSRWRCRRRSAPRCAGRAATGRGRARWESPPIHRTTQDVLTERGGSGRDELFLRDDVRHGRPTDSTTSRHTHSGTTRCRRGFRFGLATRSSSRRSRRAPGTSRGSRRHRRC